MNKAALRHQAGAPPLAPLGVLHLSPAIQCNVQALPDSKGDAVLAFESG